MTIRIVHGDCRDILPTIEADRFDCVVTSPPYWGLRDYGVEGQIGLEPTMASYLETMVGVCRELRRVLKPGGTFWLNIGSCYTTSKPSGPQGKTGQRASRTFTATGAGGAFGGMNPSQSRLPQRVPACDSDGKDIPNSQGIGSSCFGRDDEVQGGFPSRHDRTFGNYQLTQQMPPPFAQTNQRNAHLDSELADELSRLSPKALSFFGYGPGAFDLAYEASEHRKASQTFVCDVPQSAHKGACIDGTSQSASACRKSGKDASEMACNCGSCGLCFVYLATNALRIKPKDLLLIPDLLALALQADGWYVRSEIILHKPNPMPESVTDRPTCAHEKVWLLTKSAKYFYDAAAIAEQATNRDPGNIGHAYEDVGRTKAGLAKIGPKETRNARNVWSIASQPFPGSHFATMPPTLAERCIKAGCPVGGHVLDPFGGAGTTGLVADRLGRHATLIELSPAYRDMASNRIKDDVPLFSEVSS